MQHAERWLTTEDGLMLYAQTWAPEAPRAVVMLVHGYAEHSGRYWHLAEYLAQAGYALEAYDCRGHGRSAGRRAYVQHFADYVADASLVAAEVRRRWQGKPVFLLGHSMGGTISTLLALQDQALWSGLILSSAALKLANVSPLLQRLATLVSALAPSLPTVKIDSRVISRDAEVVRRYDSDPLNYRGGAPARFGAQFALGIAQACRQMAALELPLLVLCGGADQLIDPEGSRQLYAVARSDDKTLRCYDPCYHELFNEPEQDQVLADTVNWLDTHP